MSLPKSKKLTGVAVCLPALLWVFLGVEAGDLEPPGPPAPTMVTLQELFDQSGKGPVPKTGQAGCWGVDGIPVACGGTGQDGEYQSGSSVAPRFTDNGDGTTTDILTELTWLTDANCFGQRTWEDALSDANGLGEPACGLSDGSVAGDWRLPNINEMQSLIDYGEEDPALPHGHGFADVQTTGYWSSTTAANVLSGAWAVYLWGGITNPDSKVVDNYLWPIRGGQ